MLLFLFVIFVSSVVSSGLAKINPYDDNPNTKYYLYLGCKLLATKSEDRYDSDKIRKNQYSTYNRDCMLAIWPGGHFCSIKSTSGPSHNIYSSFKRGEEITIDKGTSLIAQEDGFILPGFPNHHLHFYYHRSKHLMNLRLLQKLPWPQDKALMKYRDSGIETGRILSQQRQLDPADVMIKLKNKSNGIPFVSFIDWIKRFFDMREYDAARLKAFHHILKSEYPGINPFKIHKSGSKTLVTLYHNRFTLIPPDQSIATMYDPEALTIGDSVTISEYSTIITDFKKEGSVYCLVLYFKVFKLCRNDL